jgi:hypothetical protein
MELVWGGFYTQARGKFHLEKLPANLLAECGTFPSAKQTPIPRLLQSSTGGCGCYQGEGSQSGYNHDCRFIAMMQLMQSCGWGGLVGIYTHCHRDASQTTAAMLHAILMLSDAATSH